MSGERSGRREQNKAENRAALLKAARNPQPWLKPGDICEIEIQKIGVLRNVITQGA